MSTPHHKTLPWPCPVEIVLQILSYLPSKTHLALAATHNYFRAIALPSVYQAIRFTILHHRTFKAQVGASVSLNRLLRSLVNNRTLAGYIGRIELVRWNVNVPWAGIAAHNKDSDGVILGGGNAKKNKIKKKKITSVIFKEAEMQNLRQVLADMVSSTKCSVGYPEGCNQEKAAGEPGTCNTSAKVEAAINWWMERLKRGSLDASFAVIMFLVFQGQVDTRRGLWDLQLILDHIRHPKTEPVCLWWLLWHLLVKACHSYQQHSESRDFGSDDSSVSANVFPWLRRIEIRAQTGFAKEEFLHIYHHNFTNITMPLMFHRSLTELRLSLGPFTVFGYDSSIPLCWSTPMNMLTDLDIKVSHVSKVFPVLLCSRNLTTLSFTAMTDVDDEKDMVLDRYMLGSALALVKETIVELTLRAYIWCNPSYPFHKKSPTGHMAQTIGEPLQLGLWQFPRLRHLSAGLVLLMGDSRTCGITLADVLPVSLEVFELVCDHGDKSGDVDIEKWEDEQILAVTRRYMNERGKGVGGLLEKLVFVNVSSWPHPPWSKKLLPELEMAAAAAGVRIEGGVVKW
ncbi:hypothetical protein EV426DRAFT_623170 [Tirmania nivea]|nr:hypothetical protein EV426DRAFT_623170 [Tirmania nivea]